MRDLSNRTDLELLADLKAGRDDAFMEIFERYNAPLFAYAYRKLQNKQEAQDVVQDVFTKLWEQRSDFVLKTYLSGFLYKSVLNKVLDAFCMLVAVIAALKGIEKGNFFAHALLNRAVRY